MKILHTARPYLCFLFVMLMLMETYAVIHMPDWLFYGLTVGILILTVIVLTDAIRKKINEHNEQES